MNTEILWKRFNVPLRAYIIGKVKDTHIAEDILQETFIRIHSNIGSLKDATRTQAWVYQIAHNQVMDHFRKSQKVSNDTMVDDKADEINPEDSMSEALSDMVKMMDDLPAEYCDSLCSTELGSMSISEYAASAGISYTAAKTRIFRAKRMLKDMLMQCCHYQFDKYGTVLDISPAGCCCCCPDEKPCSD